jgi:lysozyme
MRIPHFNRTISTSIFVALLAPGLARGAREFGVDVSHFQGATGIAQANWNQMSAEGKSFAFIKATEGLTGPDDTTMAVNVARADAASIYSGVYHFAHPENRPTPSGAVQEADHFVAFAGSAIGPGHLRPVLDLERGNGLGATALTDWVVAFVNEVVALRGAGAEPIIYTSSTYAGSFLDSRVSSYDLWLLFQSSPADPNTAEPPAGATGNFGNWAFWQYTVASAGGISPIDLDVAHSEIQPVAAFLIPEPASVGFAMAALGVTVVQRRLR